MIALVFVLIGLVLGLAIAVVVEEAARRTHAERERFLGRWIVEHRGGGPDGG